MKYVSFIFTLFYIQIGYSQNKTDSINIQKFNKEIEIEVELAKSQFDNFDSDEFKMYTIDTLRVNTFHRKFINYDSSTSGIYYVIWHAYDQYNILIEKYYNLLLQELDSRDKILLEESQKNWNIYKETEIDIINSIFDKKSGSMYILLRSSSILSIVEDRLDDLYHKLLWLNE